MDNNDSLFNVRSFSFDELKELSISSRYDAPPKFFVGKNNRIYHVVKLDYRNKLKVGDMYMEFGRVYYVQSKEHHGMSSSEFFGTEACFRQYYVFRVIKKKRLG